MINSLQAISILPADLPALTQALQEAGLPADDISLPDRIFYVFQLAGEHIGYAGIEVHGSTALLRSVVIAAQQRRHGLGSLVIKEMERLAHERHIQSLHLLTTNQAPFFQRIGYALTPRELAPAEIAGTSQFKSLCPSSASYLRKTLASNGPVDDEPARP